jgi:hypothetical protein
MTCSHCNGTQKALYFSELSMTHEERTCHVCRGKERDPDIFNMVTGPYHYLRDVHACFRVQYHGRLVACVYATDGEDQAEADAMMFAKALCAVSRPPRAKE